jgi:16S rRNA C967 or C1407 C5-methylase (RsmB/RsmF family)
MSTKRRATTEPEVDSISSTTTAAAAAAAANMAEDSNTTATVPPTKRAKGDTDNDNDNDNDAANTVETASPMTTSTVTAAESDKKDKKKKKKWSKSERRKAHRVAARERKRQGHFDGRGDQKSNWSTIDVATVQNEGFNKYYRAQNLFDTEEEWTQFFTSLRTQLPLTFRINDANAQGDIVKRLMMKADAFGLADGVELDGVKIKAPEPLSWYPGNVAWFYTLGRKTIRRVKDNPKVMAFRRFLVDITELGLINRQEAVSMLPPLFLDVKPHHKVLDMCAAPGSKTAQFANEVLHQSLDGGSRGLVVANDAESKRCYLLSQALGYLACPDYLVLTHKAQSLPNIAQAVDSPWHAVPETQTGENASSSAAELEAISDTIEQHKASDMCTSATMGIDPESTVTTRRMRFDRVLCDVPCSGDGTIRKNILVWRKWTSRDGHTLHPLQLAIALRGLQQLAVGGKLVYSTCSMNPIENEAVVAELLRRARGAVEIVDVSDMMPTLIRHKGLSQWKVDDGAGEFTNSITEWKASGKPDDGKRVRVFSSMFPPTATEAKHMHLARCIRMYPHSQDTGGFFVTVLRKTKSLPSDLLANEPVIAPRGINEDGTHIELPPKPVTETAVESQSSSTAQDVSTDANADANANADAAVGADADAGADADVEPAPASSNKPKKGRNAGRYTDFDMLRPVKPQIAADILDYFGIDRKFVEPCMLWTRTQDRGAATRIKLMTRPVLDILSLKFSQNDRIKVVTSGIGAFAATTMRGTELAFRITQTGISYLGPLVTKRIVDITPETLVKVLSGTTAPTPFSEMDEKTQASAAQYEGHHGSVVLKCHDEAISSKPLFIAGSVSHKGIALYIKKKELAALRSVLERMLQQ